MICACDEEYARRFLPHQIGNACDLDTGQKVAVTLGFQKSICNACRGLPEDPCPKHPMYGHTSKIQRYYWREIHMETTRRFGAWCERQGHDDWLVARRKHKEKYGAVEKEVIAEIKGLHESSPKYKYSEKSAAEVLAEHGVEVVELRGQHDNRDGKMVIVDGNKALSSEEFVVEHFNKQGYNCIITESVPFHTLFGIFMWLLIEDVGDEQNRVVQFGDRHAFEEGIRGKMVMMCLPPDFGKPGYYLRRRNAVDEHLSTLRVDKEELLWLFDYWKGDDYSGRLRQYLWAHRPESVATARRLVGVLPVDTIIRILEFLVQDYWGRYLGWPDMLVYRDEGFFFVEVKSSKDKLSEDQKKWIALNDFHLKLPFKVAKIHNVIP